MKLTLEKVIRSVNGILSMPDIFYRIDKAVEDPASSADSIAKIILEDQGLTVRVLKLANSAYYAYPSKINTITRALMVIGTSQLRDLVMATLIMKQFSDVPTDLVDVNAFWRHSIASGLAARSIATLRRESNVESFYVAGLMHDIGRLVLLMVAPKQISELMIQCRQKNIMLYRAERDILGFSHAQVAQALFKQWKLPVSLQVAAAYHHAPRATTNFQVEAITTHLADVLAFSMQLGSSGESFAQKVDLPAIESLGLDDNALLLITKQIESHYKNAVKIFLDDD